MYCEELRHLLPAAQHKASVLLPPDTVYGLAVMSRPLPTQAGSSCRIVALKVMVLRLSKVEKLTGRKEKDWVQTIQNNTSSLQICFPSCSWMLLGSVSLL